MGFREKNATFHLTVNVSSNEFMYDVRISDSVYEEASRAAKEHHVTVEKFIEEAVQFRLRDPQSITLTSDQMAKVLHAQAQVRAGQVLTMDEVERRATTNRAKWQKDSQH
jgi:ABC-type Mn2+/Zn2+ transport system ATPase subunit